MLPVWIISLGENKDAEEKLKSLLGGISSSLTPFWQYTHLATGAVSKPADYQALLGKLIEEGQNCYNRFMESGLKVNNFQIAVLGAANEAFSQSVFAPMPGILRDLLPMIVPDHANRGVEITGLLYIPSTVNQDMEDAQRQRTAIFLEEVLLMSGANGVPGYNAVLAYQDIQYQQFRFYERLDTGDRAELLFQYLVHLYLGSRDNEKLLDRIGQGAGVYALGAASVFFNPQAHRSLELTTALKALVGEFTDKENSDAGYADNRVKAILDSALLFPEDIADRLREGCTGIDADLRKLDDKADPHPVWDLLNVELLPAYYKRYLKFMPARLIRYMKEFSYALLSRFVGIIRKNVQEASESKKNLLTNACDAILRDKANPFATLAQLEAFYGKAKDYLEARRADSAIPYSDIIPVPAYLAADYARCQSDPDGTGSPAMILDELKKNLRKEPIILSLVVRCFFLGLALVLIAVSVLRVLAPVFMHFAWLWIPVLLLLPLLVEMLGRVRRHFKRIRRLKFRLLASTLLSVNRSLFTELTAGMDNVYENLIAECQRMIDYLGKLREQLSVPDDETADGLIPRTRFNQPLLEGDFMGEKMVTDTHSVESAVSLPAGTKPLSKVEKGDFLAILKCLFEQTSFISMKADALLGHFKEDLDKRLQSSANEDIPTLLERLADKADLSPLKKMAGPNGMLFSVPSNNQMVVKASNEIRALENVVYIKDKALSEYLLMTSWEKLSQGLNTGQLCNCTLSAAPKLTFPDKLALYYAFYRNEEGTYRIGSIPVSVKKSEMEEIDTLIRG